MDIFERLSLAGLIPVIKIQNAADAVPLCRALKNGGLPVAEITFRTDAAEEAIRLVHEQLPDVLLGAGTVLTKDQADRAVAAGASYIVSSGLNPEVVRHCQSKGYPVLPGCANPSDVETALSLGLHTVKLFPAEALGGVKLIRAMAAPYGDVKFVPTGGISEKNLPDYLACPAVAACGGSWMVPQSAIDEQDWGRVETLTREAVRVMLGLYIAHVGINNPDEESTRREAQKLSLLLGLPVIRDNPNSLFVSTEIEMMKTWYRGTHGHLAIATRDVKRAMWHLQQRGFTFDESTVRYAPDGRLKFIYIQEEIAGFAIHLLLDEKQG